MPKKYQPKEPEILLTEPKNWKQLTIDHIPLTSENPDADRFDLDDEGTLIRDKSSTVERVRGVRS